MPGFRELTHEDMYHRANPGTKKRKIDRIWTNIESARIQAIYQTCENKDLSECDLGHKPVVIVVDEEKKVSKQIKILRLKKLKKLASAFNVEFSKTAKDIETIEKQESTSKFLESIIKRLCEKATIT